MFATPSGDTLNRNIYLETNGSQMCPCPCLKGKISIIFLIGGVIILSDVNQVHCINQLVIKGFR